MTASNIRAELERQGVQLLADGDKLRYHPRSAVTADMLTKMAACKDDLLRLVRDCPGRKKCSAHLDPADWQKERDARRPGWIRTICRRCGTFLGYNPG